MRHCLERNIACRALDSVCVLAEPSAVELPSSPKLIRRSIATRPQYDSFFRWIADSAAPDDVSIIANPDIYFDESIGVLHMCPPPAGTVYALSRWDITAEGEAVLYDHNDSQDVWVVRGRADRVTADFPMGVPRCDNRIAMEFELAGYRVLNPSFSIRSFHLHAGKRSAYDAANLPHFVDPPYKYVWPHNLRGLAATVLHNTLYPSHQLRWRFDARVWKHRLKLHWLDSLKAL